MKYGIYDTQDNIWYGDMKGPKLFEDTVTGHGTIPGETLAKIAAQMVDVQLNQAPGRSRPRPYDLPTARLRDIVTTTKSPLQALEHIEKGGL